jgi:GDP-D-mannose dehydratase
MDSELKRCRICQGGDFTDIIDLGYQIITSRFPKIEDPDPPSTRICLVQCRECSLVQLKYTVNACELYENLYGYRSGINHTMRQHLKDYNQELVSKVDLKDNDYVLDIGSNDATTLKCYSNRLNRVGIDPTGKQFEDYYTDNIMLIPTYFTKSNIQDRFGSDVKFKLVSSISMFYDLPDPVQFAKDIHDIIDDEGIWTLEQSYLLTMIEKNSIDTICHEHLEYYGVKQIKNIMDRAGLKILYISLNDCNGGSFRIFVAKKNSKYEEATDLVKQFLDREELAGIHHPETYELFMKTSDRQIELLKNFINTIKSNDKDIYIYGASTKGNCLLQYGNIGPECIQYAVERNPLKIGLTTSTRIPIISEETMRSNPPAYQLVLPWHFRDEIIVREQQFLENGGQFIFPFPQFEIYSNKSKVLITGIHGQIAHYVIEKYRDNSNIYGLCRSIKPMDKCVIQCPIDMTNYESLQNIVLSINPDIIIHLASISSFDECSNDITQTIYVNGMIAVNLCDIIHKNDLKTKLFNASSCVNYEGHDNYTIEENDMNLRPTSAYGIAKTLSQNVIDYYRNKYDKPFSNGILFTTESKHRVGNFLIRKISDHAQSWKQKHDVLPLYDLEGYRNILHANDVADAIVLIMNQSKGDNYLICNDSMVKISDVVAKIYKLHDIELYTNDNIIYDSHTNLPVIELQGDKRKGHSYIDGKCEKLKSLGWKAGCSISDILRDMN